MYWLIEGSRNDETAETLREGGVSQTDIWGEMFLREETAHAKA